jgi:hypothetical protein
VSVPRAGTMLRRPFSTPENAPMAGPSVTFPSPSATPVSCQVTAPSGGRDGGAKKEIPQASFTFAGYPELQLAASS